VPQQNIVWGPLLICRTIYGGQTQTIEAINNVLRAWDEGREGVREVTVGSPPRPKCERLRAACKSRITAVTPARVKTRVEARALLAGKFPRIRCACRTLVAARLGTSSFPKGALKETQPDVVGVSVS